MATREDIEAAKGPDAGLAGLAPYPEYPDVLANLARFQRQKVGLLLHWGLYARAGIVESWQLSDEDGWARGHHPFRPNMRQLKHDYWGLADGFAPTHYDPTAWADLFKQAGIRYAILTTKHHDGFNLFDTAYSDYKVQADLVAPFTQAMRAQGIVPGLYYSKADWHHPAYWRLDGKPKGRHADYLPSADLARWRQFTDFVHHQLLELTQNYGPLGMLWLDAGWVNGDREPLDFDRVMPAIRQAQPGMLIVDRTMGGRYEQYVTPERQIPSLADRPRMPWEANVPLSNDWGFVPHADYKSLKTVIGAVLAVVSLGGNIVLGLGPKADGTLPKPAVDLLLGLGGWLAQNGAGIYNTRAATPTLIQRAASMNLFVTEDDAHYYLFFKRAVPPAALDLARLGISASAATVLGTTRFLPLVGHQLKIPGGLRQALFPGLCLTKKGVD